MAIPQILTAATTPDLPGTAHYPAFHWGYIVDPPTLTNVATYLAFIFGLKLILVAAALIAGNSANDGSSSLPAAIVAVFSGQLASRSSPTTSSSTPGW